MWKVSNDKNKVKLDKFKTKIIYIFWRILLERLQNKNSYKVTETFVLESKEIIQLPSAELFIKKVLKRKIDKVSLLKVMTIIIEKYSYIEISEEFSNYISQNNQINLLNFNIVEIEVLNEMKKIFNEFFYEKFFSDEQIWNYIDGVNFTRDDFHMNFLEENRIKVCPYCDIETIYLEGNRYIEHFLPQSRFPYLSMNPNNLASACSSCNGTATGKGSGIKNPIISLYNKQIGDEIKFELVKNEKLIKLNTALEENKNYIDLLKLQKNMKIF